MGNNRLFTVYKITNTKNGKAYIGISKYTADERFCSHVKESKRLVKRHAFSYALSKYGVNAFLVETLETVETWEAAKEKEIAYIVSFNTHIKNGNGYNMTNGGEGSSGRVLMSSDNQEYVCYSKKPKTTIYLTDRDKRDIEKIKEFEGVNQSTAIRMAISYYARKSFNARYSFESVPVSYSGQSAASGELD